ncbi:hypothetical protein PHET_01264 [Paragonimus heterotremus]|uniref:Uncharacterized protein n=1 Tax=Paragonimus heterotremus TaxID=100268 RepID=A0A8J4STM8_9TREM|nr:hypothetical protein PHET_01264 [Paragonimus heterotremus]
MVEQPNLQRYSSNHLSILCKPLLSYYTLLINVCPIIAFILCSFPSLQRESQRC